MKFQNYTYLLVLAFTIAVPLFLSFDKKVQYYKKLKYILPAIFITAAIFVIWDIKFTAAQIWTFNPDYIIGTNFKGLPIEEWLFFFVIPYSCVFIYEVLKYYIPQHEYANPFLAFSLILIVGFALVTYFFWHHIYTFYTFLFSTVYLTYTVFRNKFKPYITKFYFTYFLSLVPFMVVNGILTSIPVVEYNSAYILNIRLLSIPVEDFAYFFLMLLIVTTLYETLKESKYY